MFVPLTHIIVSELFIREIIIFQEVHRRTLLIVENYHKYNY